MVVVAVATPIVVVAVSCRGAHGGAYWSKVNGSRQPDLKRRTETCSFRYLVLPFSLYHQWNQCRILGLSLSVGVGVDVDVGVCSPVGWRQVWTRSITGLCGTVSPSHTYGLSHGEKPYRRKSTSPVLNVTPLCGNTKISNNFSRWNTTQGCERMITDRNTSYNALSRQTWTPTT